jgi:EAL domain-containing protein (putative c-di-GMP-specific phosphodiesterase class I)
MPKPIDGVRRMSVNHLHKTVLLLFVAVMADSLVAVVLRIGSIRAFMDGNRSFVTLVALAGLGCLVLLFAVTLRALQDILNLWHQVTTADARIALLEASALMSAAQTLGRRSRVDPDLGPAAVAARARMVDLLDRGNLTIAMQPIIDLQRDGCVTAEALARFPDGRGPDAWFREAQEMGLGVELELLAVSTALARTPELPQSIGVSINASPSLILDPRLAQTIYQSGIPLDRLTLEITEHAAVTEYDDIKSALLVLRERGVLLAVDDMGAGYASFSHVLKLRPDVIKIDRSMVADIAVDAAKRAFVTAIVLLALELDATITAEGVETCEELDTVESLGVDHAQGFHIGRPDTSGATWRSWSSRRWMSPIFAAPARLHHDA